MKPALSLLLASASAILLGWYVALVLTDPSHPHIYYLNATTHVFGGSFDSQVWVAAMLRHWKAWALSFISAIYAMLVWPENRRWIRKVSGVVLLAAWLIGGPFFSILQGMEGRALNKHVDWSDLNSALLSVPGILLVLWLVDILEIQPFVIATCITILLSAGAQFLYLMSNFHLF